MRAYMGDTAASRSTRPSRGDGPKGGDSRAARRHQRIQREAEDAVRGGCTHVILSDKAPAPDRAPIPMILATGAVHSPSRAPAAAHLHLAQRALGECLDVHYFAVLIGVGATTVNAYLAQETIADRHRRGLFAGSTIETCIERYKKAVDEGLLKIMSKMGIAVISSYRGAYNFEAVGLSRTLVAEFFPGMDSRISGMGLSGIQHEGAGDRTSAPSTRIVVACRSAASTATARAASCTASTAR